MKQLLSITHKIFQSLDEGYEDRSVFLYIFYIFIYIKVWHKGLIFKLSRNVLSGNLLDILSDFSSDRKQRVVHNTAWKLSKYGVFSGPYFPRIGAENRDFPSKCPYSVWIEENTDQKYGVFTQCNSQKSTWGNVNAGFSQDSILVPLLLLIYTNDLSGDSFFKAKSFADDTSLFWAHGINTSANDSNSDLKKVSN